MEKSVKNRIITSRECKYGNLSEFQKEQAKAINENPSFDAKLKPYRYIKNFKSNTKNHGWLFEFNGKIFAAMQLWISQLGESVIIFNANQKGDFSISKDNEVTQYLTYVDIESAVDKFVTEYNDI